MFGFIAFLTISMGNLPPEYKEFITSCVRLQKQIAFQEKAAAVTAEFERILKLPQDERDKVMPFILQKMQAIGKERDELYGLTKTPGVVFPKDKKR
jgi:hypothetical protein